MALSAVSLVINVKTEDLPSIAAIEEFFYRAQYIEKLAIQFNSRTNLIIENGTTKQISVMVINTDRDRENTVEQVRNTLTAIKGNFTYCTMINNKYTDVSITDSSSNGGRKNKTSKIRRR
jgi:hypothetical protein